MTSQLPQLVPGFRPRSLDSIAPYHPSKTKKALTGPLRRTRCSPSYFRSYQDQTARSAAISLARGIRSQLTPDVQPHREPTHLSPCVDPSSPSRPLVLAQPKLPPLSFLPWGVQAEERGQWRGEGGG